MTSSNRLMKWLGAAALGAASAGAIAQEPGYVDLQQDGGFVAFFEVTWKEPPENTEKKWTSGDQAAGYKTRVSFPAKANKIRIKGGVHTGLAWDKVRYVDMRFPKPTNNCFRLVGTPLAPSWDKC